MKKNSLIFMGLILMAGAFRLIPHTWNFTPILAVCIFSGYKIKPLGLALFLPLLTIFLGDLFIGFYEGMVWVYAAYIVTIAFALFTNKSNSVQSKVGNVIIGSISFFIISNFGVWMSGLLYPKNVDGVMACYIAAIPFFKNTFLGTLIYSFGFFAVAETLERHDSAELSTTQS